MGRYADDLKEFGNLIERLWGELEPLFEEAEERRAMGEVLSALEKRGEAWMFRDLYDARSLDLAGEAISAMMERIRALKGFLFAATGKMKDVLAERLREIEEERARLEGEKLAYAKNGIKTVRKTAGLKPDSDFINALEKAFVSAGGIDLARADVFFNIARLYSVREHQGRTDELRDFEFLLRSGEVEVLAKLSGSKGLPALPAEVDGLPQKKRFKMRLDGKDSEILDAIREEGEATSAGIGEKLDIHRTTALRKLRRLEDLGLIVSLKGEHKKEADRFAMR